MTNLTPVAREVLVALLDRHDDVPSNLAEHTDRHRKSVSRKLKELEKEGYVESKGAGVYRLTSDGVLLARAIRAEGETR